MKTCVLEADVETSHQHPSVLLPSLSTAVHSAHPTLTSNPCLIAALVPGRALDLAFQGWTHAAILCCPSWSCTRASIPKSPCPRGPEDCTLLLPIPPPPRPMHCLRGSPHHAGLGATEGSTPKAQPLHSQRCGMISTTVKERICCVPLCTGKMLK